MKKILFKNAGLMSKCFLLIFLLLFFRESPAFSEMPDNISTIRTWDHGTYYRIVFVLKSPDTASLIRNGENQITVKFKNSGFKKEKWGTVNKKYIKDVTFIQENPLILKMTLQDFNYKSSSMELKNPTRFVMDVKKYSPKTSDKKIIIRQDKVKKSEKKQISEANKIVTQKAKKKHLPLKKDSKAKERKIALSEEKLLDKFIPDDADEKFLAAIKDIKEKKYEDAFKAFSTIAEEKNKCSLISEVLSAEALIKKDSEKKDDDFLQAIEILGSASGKKANEMLMAKIYYLLGTAYSNIKFYEEAEGYFKILQNNYPDSYYAKTGKLEMAKILSTNNKLAESCDYLDDLSKDDPNGNINKEMLLLYFNNYFRMKEYKKACEKFEKAVGISKDSEISEISYDDWYRYAESLYQVKRYKEAKGIFIEVSDKEINEEKKAGSILRLGDIRFSEGGENEALNIWSTIPLDYQNTVAAGEAILRITSTKIKNPENYDEALLNYTKIISSDFPAIIKNEAITATTKLFSENHQYNKALIFLKSTETEGNEEIHKIINMEARKIFDNGLSFFREKENKDKSLELYFRYNELSELNVKDFAGINIFFLAETLTDSAYFQEAREILQALYIGTFNQNLAFNCQYLIGLSYLKEKEYGKAVSRFKKVIGANTKSENSEKVGQRLAQALYFQKKYDESLTQLLKLKNKNADSEFLISKNYFFIGDYKNALLHFRKSAELSKGISPKDNLYSKSLFWESYCHYKIGETKDALSVLEHINNKWKRENRDDVILLKAQILNREGKRKDALKILESKSDKNSPIALLADNLKEEIEFTASHKRSLNFLKRKENPLKNE